MHLGDVEVILGCGYRELVRHEDRDHQARIRLAALEAAWSRWRGDTDAHALDGELIARSDKFRQLWDRHEPGLPPDDHKTLKANSSTSGGLSARKANQRRPRQPLTRAAYECPRWPNRESSHADTSI